MNRRLQMQEGNDWILPNEMNANRFFWDWLEIWLNHLFHSMGPNGVTVAMDSEKRQAADEPRKNL
jgi:hypothetical protein